ncbi:MAG: hypothetical protein M5U19_05005 [Microthrixaceae bacterium]|nr:hypothetical protein [Microthrixaceae bacterium]
MVSPLWRPHVAAVSIPLALVIAVYRPPLRVAVVAAVIAVPMVFVQLDGLTAPGDYHGTQAELFDALGELPEGALVMSDEPGVLWRSGARSTDDLVDPSMLRREQHRYTADTLVRDARTPVCVPSCGTPNSASLISRTCRSVSRQSASRPCRKSATVRSCWSSQTAYLRALTPSSVPSSTGLGARSRS